MGKKEKCCLSMESKCHRTEICDCAIGSKKDFPPTCSACILGNIRDITNSS